MRQALNAVAGVLSENAAAADAGHFAWERVHGEQARRLRSVLSEKYAPTTTNKMLSAFRGIMRTYRDRGVISEVQYQQAARLDAVRDFRDRPSRTLTRAELKRLFQVCASDGTAAGRRDAALLAIFVATGVRRAEAVEINVQDYDPKGSKLRINSEFPERVRDVDLGPRCCAALEHYLEVRGNEPGPLLLPVDRGGTIRFRRLTDQAVYLIMQRIAEQAELRDVTTRDLRRTCVSRMIASGMSLEAVRAKAGHLNWLTTTAYQEFAKDAGAAAASLDPPYIPPKGVEP